MATYDNLKPNPIPFKMKNQFVLVMDGIEAYTVKSFKRPDITFEEIQIPFINGRIYQAGRGEFGTATMTLMEPIVPSASQAIMTYINRVWDWNTGKMGVPDIYKTTFTLKELSGPGTIVSEWSFEGAWPQSVDFNESSYEDSSVTEIMVTWRFDYVTLKY